MHAPSAPADQASTPPSSCSGAVSSCSFNAFSKKWDNHRYALALYFAAYDFVTPHGTLTVDPLPSFQMNRTDCAFASGLRPQVAWNHRMTNDTRIATIASRGTREVVAAVVSGVIDIDTALRLIHRRPAVQVETVNAIIRGGDQFVRRAKPARSATGTRSDRPDGRATGREEHGTS